MSKVISVTLQKGGVGKSTTSQALGSILGSKGNKVLLIDMDSQGNLSYSCGIVRAERTIYEVISNQCDITDAIQKNKYYDVISADISLTNATLELKPSDNLVLKTKIDMIKGDYDFIIIDTPPSLGVLSINSLMASDYLVIPTEPSSYSLQGISELHDTVKAVQGSNKDLKILGILLIKYNNRTVLNRQIKEMIQEFADRMNIKLFDTTISESITVRESQAMQEDLIDYAPKSRPALDYIDLVNEIIKELK